MKWKLPESTYHFDEAMIEAESKKLGDNLAEMVSKELDEAIEKVLNEQK